MKSWNYGLMMEDERHRLREENDGLEVESMKEKLYAKVHQNMQVGLKI